MSHDVLIGEDDAVRTLDHRFLVPGGGVAMGCPTGVFIRSRIISLTFGLVTSVVREFYKLFIFCKIKL